MTRVLVVDDSALMRHRLSAIINAAPGLEVVGTASNGQACLNQLARLQPDVITLDVEMPEMDGLSTLGRIMGERPTPVLMISSLTEAGAATTLEALALGAVDYLAKPGALSTRAGDPFSVELARKLAIVARSRPSRPSTHERPARQAGSGPKDGPRLAGASPGARSLTGGAPEPTAVPTARALSEQERRARPISGALGCGEPLVVVGSSTGGPPALDGVFAALGDLPSAMLVVQHMPPLFTASLAARLDKRWEGSVREAVDGDAPAPGVALVAPGGRHLVMGADRRLHLDDGPPLHGVRPAIDQTLLSVAAHWRGPILTVILTGMGVDGAAGARAARGRGGAVIAQDEETSVVYGMPRAVADAGLATAILPLDRIGQAIDDWARAARAARATSA